MDKNNGSLQKFFAGFFFIAGLVLFGAAVFVIGLDRGLTQQKFQVIALFNDVNGLVAGAPIRISGISVGLVGGVDFLEQSIEGRSLKVTMNIFKKYEFQFSKCSRISIRTEGVLGQKLVEISEDHSRKVFDMTKPIVGEDSMGVEDVTSAISRTAVSLQATSESLRDALNDWKYISHKGKRLINSVQDKLNEGSLFKIF